MTGLDMEVNVLEMRIPDCDNYMCNKCYMHGGFLTDSCCSLYQLLIKRVVQVFWYIHCAEPLVPDVSNDHAAFIVK
jgi:hypothetical protein